MVALQAAAELETSGASSLEPGVSENRKVSDNKQGPQKLWRKERRKHNFSTYYRDSVLGQMGSCETWMYIKTKFHISASSN